MVKDIKISDYDYSLPAERIPGHPLETRDECKLLLRDPKGRIYHRKFKELPDLLPPGTLMVCNDTKVIHARLLFHKETGAAIELFLLEPIEPADYVLNFQSKGGCEWKCLVGNSKKWKEGRISLEFEEKGLKVKLEAERVKGIDDGSAIIRFTWHNPELSFAQILEQAGKIPIPPYLNRETEQCDEDDYQTVYARVKGSVAAPTAGLHFTSRVFEGLEAHNIKTEKITLHVGAGTFKPVKSENIGGHPMHSEPFTVSLGLVEKLIEWKKRGKPVTAVGTTTVRTLESLPYIGMKLKEGAENPFIVGQWEPYEEREGFDTVETLEQISEHLKKAGKESFTASTSIMIAPGFHWRITDCMVTNFHQPKSTLLLLVSSFLGEGEWRKVYESALENDYRFLSYGDGSLLMKRKP